MTGHLFRKTIQDPVQGRTLDDENIQCGPDLLNFCRVQLSYSPLDSSRKRLTQLAEKRWQISNRGYSVSFEINSETKIIRVYALNNSVG